MLLEKVKKTIRDHGLFHKEDKILIAYSGGADSTALLHLLLELQKEWPLELFLGHFNHRLRQSAEADERFVRDAARKLSLPLFIGRGDVRSRARAMKQNIEETGRQLRYEFLNQKATEVGGAKIATGHTLTDQAETLLMRLMRGSGLRGLAGIYPVVDERLVRPLLEVEREDIEAYLKEKKIAFRMDESNFDRRFLRNRIRLELLPYIRKNFEPAIVRQLGRMASIIREEDTLLDEMAREKTKQAVKKRSHGVSLDRLSLSSVPRALARRVVRNFISELRGSLRRISFEDVESILNLDEGKEYSLKEDVVLRREANQIILKKKAAPVQYGYGWGGKGILELRELGLKFKGKKMTRENVSSLCSDDRIRVFIDFEKLRFPLTVRSRREGDRYHPLGAPGRKKVKEIFRSKGIPLAERERHPVFLSGNEIVWILGLPVSERFKIEKETKNIFEIKKQ
ncbi:MAG: tRNA lysidine(34) synthetase TilS [Candidatus Aminicenantes bacterium]|jgi:tRNA(Ile)-lysidine synthase